MNCPNYFVCHKTVKPGLKVCTSCFWRFKNEILEFKIQECPNCNDHAECVKFRKCEHFLCMKCFDKLSTCKVCQEKS
jgi:hypothetical protein